MTDPEHYPFADDWQEVCMLKPKLVIGSYQIALWNAAMAFKGCNWRRVKREMRKAGKLYWKREREKKQL